jgi:hypothetical protein
LNPRRQDLYNRCELALKILLPMNRTLRAMSGLLMSWPKHGPSVRLGFFLLMLFAAHSDRVPGAHAALRTTKSHSSPARIQEAGQPITTLEVGQVIDREIAAEQRQSFQINLSAGQYAVGANTPVENPLLRSGLALAGANRRDESGILTALEASGLNLWGTRLVVAFSLRHGRRRDQER